MKRPRPFRWRTFGKDLRVLRNLHGKSLRDFETITGVNYTTLGRAERGRPIDVPDFLHLCRRFSLRPFAYLRGKS
jgi:transcriptional regulator with XRE-family HTH domain